MDSTSDTDDVTSQSSLSETYPSDDPPPSLLADSPASWEVQSSTDSEFERYCNTIDVDADVADTHVTNEELAKRDAVKAFFKDVQKLETLENSEQREWIGSLPSSMFNEPIPLFTDVDTGIDYQLHFSYTRMKSISTGSPTEGDDPPDYYVHGLVGAMSANEVALMETPDIIIPLGKLFVNEGGRSKWTGYEVFISSDMAIWMIYAIDEDNVNIWDPVECSLSRGGALPGSAKEKESEKSNTFKAACFWQSLKTLHSATFEDAINYMHTFPSDYSMSFFRLLEISSSEVLKAFSSPTKFTHKILKTSKLRVNAKSRAGLNLLSLAALHLQKPIPLFQLKFENQAQSEFDDTTSLHWLADKHDDENLNDLLYTMEDRYLDAPFNEYGAGSQLVGTEQPYGRSSPESSKVASNPLADNRRRDSLMDVSD